MSLFFALLLILIAGLMSGLIDGMAHLGHMFTMIPWWLKWAIAAGILAWSVREP